MLRTESNIWWVGLMMTVGGFLLLSPLIGIGGIILMCASTSLKEEFDALKTEVENLKRELNNGKR